MLFYDKITESEGLDASEGTDVIRAGVVSFKRCDFCDFYFFKRRNFNYQPHVCNGCHDAFLHAQSLSDFRIITIKSGVYMVVRNNEEITYEEITRLLESNDSNQKLGYL